MHKFLAELLKIYLQSTGWDSNPRCRITGAESLPLNDQCILFSLISLPAEFQWDQTDLNRHLLGQEPSVLPLTP